MIFDIMPSVMELRFFDNAVVMEIQPPIIVHSEKGRVFKMEDRPHFGLSLCRSGQITYTMDGKEYVSDKDSAVLLPQGGSYSLHGDKAGLFPLVNFKCEHMYCDTIKIFPLENPEVCLKHFDRLKQLSLWGENRLKMFSIFYELLDSISRAPSSKNDLLRHTIAYIESNLANPTLNNLELARQANISEVYLRKLFSTHYNTTPKQYILDIRIQKAKQMLVDTPYRVAVIAEECGFSSPYHFCRAFKERTGLTPTQFASQSRIYKI